MGVFNLGIKFLIPDFFRNKVNTQLIFIAKEENNIVRRSGIMNITGIKLNTARAIFI